MTTRLPFAALAALALLSPSASAQTAAPAAAVRRVIDEANRDFSFKGKAINPLAVKDLGTGLADGEPGVVAIDLDGTYETNRYFGEYARDKDGLVRIDMRTTEVNPPDDLRGWFSYKKLGTLPNGIHVLRTSESGGGTGVFVHLLLVDFAPDFEYDEDGKRHDRVVMRRRGEFSLGDRYRGVVTVMGSTIEIGADPRIEREARVIRIP